jgi:hypothetical protein
VPATRDNPTAAQRAASLRAARGAFFVFAALCCGDALAYLDPGTGSILLQGLIAAVAATVTYASLYWQRTKAWFRGLRKRPPGDGDDANQPPP